MGNKRRGQGWTRTARRSVGLGLAWIAIWGIGATADFSQVKKAAEIWLRQPAAAVSLIAGQMGQPPQQTDLAALGYWGSLLVEQSPLLSGGKEDVLELRQQQPQQHLPPSELDIQDDDDQQKPSLQPPARDDSILETTARGKDGSQYLHRDGVYLYNRTDKKLDTSIFTAGAVHFALGEGPQILIVHTHGSEAYSQSDGEVYQESDAYRTTDCTHNVVRVGEEMAQVFRSHGFEVIHDTNLYDYPAYNGSYSRSKAAVKSWLAQYPTIKIVLDVHRDALVGRDGSIYKLVTQNQGRKVAQVMMVVGTNGAGSNHPYWFDNLALAIRLQSRLIADYTSLARPIVLRNSTYNQQLVPGYLLVEVGGHGNTLTEAIDGAHLFAESASQVLSTLKKP